MPLLGRHKSGGSAQGSAGAQSQASASGGAGGINQQAMTSRQVCESPLFGVRRQFALSSSSPPPPPPPSMSRQEASGFKAGGNYSTSGGSGQQRHINSSSSSNNNNNNQLNSIPQQITRQQIHYAFSIMDTNQDGMIDVRDLSQMLANLGIPIDEGILSHIMSTVSKRVDHRISEAEFVEWISHFIQISDSSDRLASDHKQTNQRRNNQQQASNQGIRNSGRVTRSSTASGSSLIAQPVGDEYPRTRRGSGSGLALMRSLSSSGGSSSANSATVAYAFTPSASGARSARGYESEPQTEATPSAESEARDDLKAAFCVFDLDGDGYITIDEVHKGLKLLGETWSPGELKHLFSKCSSASKTSSSDLKRQQQQQRISIDDFVQLLL